LHDRYADTLHQLTSLLPTVRKSLLYDVGAGAGAFLVEARNAGFDVAGNDISEDAVRICADRHDIQLSHRELREEEGENRVDAVTMWWFLAHVEDPRSLLADTFRLLRPNGILYFHTPRWCLIDTLGLDACRLSGGRVDHVTARRINRAHRRVYSRRNLMQLLRSVGFEVIEVSLKAGYSLRTAAYLESMRVPRILVRPIAALLDRLISSGLAPRNILDAYMRKPRDVSTAS
jgi:2-polyprenyl-3-methyl-5-hydroxy-6-metoxy-1,4-benzoquinol methylase